MPLFIATLIGITILLFGISIYYIVQDRETVEKEKLLKQFDASDRSSDRADRIMQQEAKKSGVERLLGRFLDLAALESLLMAADMPLSMERLLTISLGIGLLFVIPVLVVLQSASAIILALIAGIALPFAYLLYRKRKREAALVDQLPDTLDMIVRAIRVVSTLHDEAKSCGNQPAHIRVINRRCRWPCL
ncbi:MAG: hypothetical protein SWH61_12240 [Thermodesulfobacteriota bacterium]|nr:hypothetical protein [Thermodesulfobacteriota bacterium]